MAYISHVEAYLQKAITELRKTCKSLEDEENRRNGVEVP